MGKVSSWFVEGLKETYKITPKKKRCPKCDSTNLKILKDKGVKKFLFESPLKSAINPSKPLNVCKDCGFDWEDR